MNLRCQEQYGRYVHDKPGPPDIEAYMFEAMNMTIFAKERLHREHSLMPKCAFIDQESSCPT